VNKLKSMGLFMDKKQKHKCRGQTEDKLNDIGVRLEHTPRKSLEHPAQDIGVSKSSARRATQLLKLIPCKTTEIHAMQHRNPTLGFFLDFSSGVV
jgi:hypothetical protein